MLHRISYQLLLLCLVLIVSLWFISSPTYTPASQWNLSNSDIHRAKNILSAHQQSQGENIKLILTERDLNIAIAYLLTSYVSNQSSIQIQAQSIHFLIHFPFSPILYFQRGINLSFELYFPDTATVKIRELHLGKLSIPDNYAEFLLDFIIKLSPLQHYLELITQNLNTIYLDANQLHINYYLPKSALGHLRNLLLPNVNLDVLNLYQQRLSNSLQQHNPNWLLSIHEILQPLFALAQERSIQGNPIEENRFAILIANNYINQSRHFTYQNAIALLPVYAYKRQDIAQHFMGSAALAISSNQNLAQMISVEKEVNDAKKQSGFSFVDLAANKAGIHFGSVATASAKKARLLQKKMGLTTHYRDFIPTIKDLPENLSTADFKNQYQSIYSPEYQYMLQKIDQRIANSSIYQ